MKINKKISILLMICLIFFVIIVDLLTKHCTVGINQDFIPGFIKFFYAENTGAAWSVFSGSRIALIVFSILAILIILFYSFYSKSESKLLHISLGFIVGGAFGNLIDRLYFGYVRDFLKLEFMNFPIFNIADASLTVGVILICVYFIISGVKERKNGK